MTPQQIEALKLALEALKAMAEDLGYFTEEVPAITALEEVLKEHAMQEVQRLGQEIEQEPCVHAKTPKGCYRVRCQLGDKCVDDEMSFRTTPPQRTWVGLTEQDLDYLCNLAYTGDEEFALAVQAKLMEKNA
jgi:hypothetical protein